jgi:anti-sigma B factor antagonist
MTALTINTADSAAVGLLVIHGEVDCANADELAVTGLQLLQTSIAQSLTIDLSAVSFIDAAGLGALIRIRNAALLQHKTLHLGHQSKAVEKLLRLTALDTVFSIDLPDG